ncbi:MAG: biopolymer transporter ExbD [Phycisphaerae bacterium]|nr:biopolymer transporter ExbD [Phycisphaerae bacterium]
MYKRDDQPNISAFNMTPVIDIVFLLIIFFVVVFEFIDVDDKVTVPDNCVFARENEPAKSLLPVITVFQSQEDEYSFAVDSKQLDGNGDMTEQMRQLIDQRLERLSADRRIVTLKIDKDVPFSQAKYALAAVAKSAAEKVRIAAFKEDISKRR